MREIATNALRDHAGTAVVLLLVVACLAWAMAWMSSSLSAILETRSGGLPSPPRGLIGTAGDGGYWDTPCSASMSLADSIRTDFQLEPSRLDLVLTGEDRKRLTNVYEQGWRPGMEKVRVRIEFDVVELDEPTTLVVTDLVVR